jgi:hypothetical protein
MALERRPRLRNPLQSMNLRRFLEILVWLMAVTAIAGFVWGVCWLVVRQPELVASSPTPGHPFPHDITDRSGTPQVVYVSRAIHMTSLVSGFIFDALLRLVVAVVLVVTLGETARLLIPGRVAFANREVARYRAQVGADGVTAEGLRYVAAWRDMWRRSCLTLSILLLGLVMMWTKWPAMPGGFILFGWLITSFGGALWVGNWRCPRCGERYWMTRSFGGWLECCSHCGLIHGSGPTAESHPNFTAWKRWN